jgi:hypothetical protein
VALCDIGACARHVGAQGFVRPSVSSLGIPCRPRAIKDQTRSSLSSIRCEKPNMPGIP